MLNLRRWNPWIGVLLVAATGLGLMGCAPKTTISATGNVPAGYSHVFMTVQEIWFNASASATPEDTTWIKYSLNAPVTVDLAASMKGQLSALMSNITVPVGTYAQVRLIPVDSGSTPVAAAKSAGATFNSEVDYWDSAGNSHAVPLELQNPDKGIGIQTSLQVNGSNVNVLSSAGSSTTTPTSTNSTSTTPTSTSTTTPTSTTTTPTSTTSTTTTPTTTSTTDQGVSNTPFAMAINLDGAKDLVPFNYAGTVPVGQVIPTNGVTAILLNPHMTAYNTSLVGAVQGKLDLSKVSSGLTVPGNTSFDDIQVTAESLSTDGTRHVVVNSAPVSAADGTFTLYPLATSSSSPTSYDLVIHGKAIATVIVKGVTVNPGDPSSTTPVNIGTITARPAGQTFNVNVNTTTSTTTNTAALLPAGTLVGFYQTLPGATEVPYAIELRPIDPFSRAFPADLALSPASIDFGTFSSSGSTISLSSVNPQEGTSTYRVATSAPLFVDGILAGAPVVSPAANASLTTLVGLPLPLAASGVVGSASVSVSQTNSYDQGQLIISHDGAIVATNDLSTVLQRGGTSTLTISGLPASTGVGSTSGDALYYVSVRVWRSSNPAGTLVRETYPSPLDLRSTSSTAYSFTIN